MDATQVTYTFTTDATLTEEPPSAQRGTLEWDDVRAWLRTEGGAKRRGLSPRTVQNTMNDIRRMTAFGVDWLRFLRSPNEAKATARPYLDAKIVQGHLHSAENAQKALNRVAGYVQDVLRVPGFYDKLWRLVELPDRRFDPYTDHEREQLLAYKHPDSFFHARRRCEVFLFDHIGHRQKEVYQIRVEDIDPHGVCLRVDQGVKRGERRSVALPDVAFLPGSPLAEWLRVRQEVAGTTGPLWVQKDGSVLGEDAFHNEMWRIGRKVGVKANHNRWRHTVGSHREERGVPSNIQKKEWGHHSEDATTWYFQGRPEARRDVLIARGVRGYTGEYRVQDRVGPWWSS